MRTVTEATQLCPSSVVAIHCAGSVWEYAAGATASQFTRMLPVTFPSASTSAVADADWVPIGNTTEGEMLMVALVALTAVTVMLKRPRGSFHFLPTMNSKLPSYSVLVRSHNQVNNPGPATGTKSKLVAALLM